jgi:homoserine O-acetyltransferase
MLSKLDIVNWNLCNGMVVPLTPLFFQIFGKPIGIAKVVVVNHALTGNSNASGEHGWWSSIIGDYKVIDTTKYTVIVFNIPGNGFDGDSANLILDYQKYTIKDMASIFLLGLQQLKVQTIFAVIGGSLGGAICWEMGVQLPKGIQHIIPIASDYKASDWLIANVLLQDAILNNYDNGLEIARIHAMLLYRNPLSINTRFNNTSDSEGYRVESWLKYHGSALRERFTLPAYLLMNHLLKTNNLLFNSATLRECVEQISANILLISIDTDLFFSPEITTQTYNEIKEWKANVEHHHIISPLGHDAFLLEHEQLTAILQPIF